jgi:hypothetical protein
MIQVLSGEKQRCQPCDYFPQIPDYHDFQIIRRKIQGILPHKFSVYVNITDILSLLLLILL